MSEGEGRSTFFGVGLFVANEARVSVSSKSNKSASKRERSRTEMEKKTSHSLFAFSFSLSFSFVSLALSPSFPLPDFISTPRRLQIPTSLSLSLCLRAFIQAFSFYQSVLSFLRGCCCCCSPLLRSLLPRGAATTRGAAALAPAAPAAAPRRRWPWSPWPVRARTAGASRSKISRSV